MRNVNKKSKSGLESNETELTPDSASIVKDIVHKHRSMVGIARKVALYVKTNSVESAVTALNLSSETISLLLELDNLPEEKHSNLVGEFLKAGISDSVLKTLACKIHSEFEELRIQYGKLSTADKREFIKGRVSKVMDSCDIEDGDQPTVTSNDYVESRDLCRKILLKERQENLKIRYPDALSYCDAKEFELIIIPRNTANFNYNAIPRSEAGKIAVRVGISSPASVDSDKFPYLQLAIRNIYSCNVIVYLVETGKFITVHSECLQTIDFLYPYELSPADLEMLSCLQSAVKDFPADKQ